MSEPKANAKPKPKAKGVTKGGARAAVASPSPFGHGDLPTSLLLVFPLFLLYEIGVMFSPTVNGVDFVTRWVLAAVDYDRRTYLIVHLVLAGLFLCLLLYLRKTRRFSLKVLPPMLIESAIYALALGTVIVFVMDRVLGLGVADSAAVEGDASALSARGQAVVMSLGAGVHEEFVFRLGLMGGGIAALLLAGARRGAAVTVALLVSAALFSLAHHVGPLGEPFDAHVFVYRALAGVAFGLIFYYRSFAHAVYVHFFYDVYVFLFA